jgi:DNA-binding NarL/FixJ family response regulator
MSRVYVLNGNNAIDRVKAVEPFVPVAQIGQRAAEAHATPERVPRPVTSCFLLIDRQPLRRAWVLASLDGWDLGDCLAALASAVEVAPRLADRTSRIDLVILSIGNATATDPVVAEELRWLREHLPEVPVTLLADRDDPASILAALCAGVRGYLPTSIDPGVARKALALVLAGGAYAPPALLFGTGMTGGEEPVRRPDDAAPCERLNQLTPRQREVLALLGQGRPNKVIAQHLAMCESTVKVHVRQIMRKLGATNRTEVALKLRELATPAPAEVRAPVAAVRRA